MKVGDFIKKLYGLIKLSSIFIREYLLPNPFGNRANAEALNWMLGIVLYIITYPIVGLFYRPRSNPPLGSLLYLFFYAIHTGLVSLMGVFEFSKFSVITIISIYIIILIGIKILQSKIRHF